MAVICSDTGENATKMLDIVADVVAHPGDMSLTSLESQQHKIGMRR